MFTGIIQEVGTARETGESTLTVEASATLEGTSLGDSIAVNGACLTVNAMGEGWFSVDVMPETLRRTNLGRLQPGSPVNLERALTLSTPLGGHLTQGHVDATGTLVSAEPEGGAVLMRFQAPPQVMKYVVEKGFIAVDGISLTVMAYDASTFTVSVVEYTQTNTNLGHGRPGDLFNLEVDILAKYVEKLLSNRDVSAHGA